MTPFDFINAINQTKENLIVDEPSEKAYAPFIVNRGLSFFPDTILYANEMNQYHFLESKAQFLYLLYSIRAKKRYSKWIKKDKNDTIDAVCEYFKCNRKRANEYLMFMSESQIEYVKSQNTK